jgi:hypothetical protein
MRSGTKGALDLVNRGSVLIVAKHVAWQLQVRPWEKQEAGLLTLYQEASASN